MTGWSVVKTGYVYILASKYNGTLYIGVTANLLQRVYQHKEGLIAGFTKRYNIKNLVYYECYNDIKTAIENEKKLKNISRNKKISIIERDNPKWQDLYQTLF